jgi:site-specific recombinase XerD
MADPSLVVVSGPLGPYVAGFQHALRHQGYTPPSIVIQLQLVADLSTWLVHHGLDLDQLDAAAIARFLAARRRAGVTRYVSERAMRPVVMYLRDHGVAPSPPPVTPTGPTEMMLDAYAQYLQRERGLQPTTVTLYLHCVRPFVSRRIARDGVTVDWASLHGADVIDFVLTRTRQQSRGAAKLTVSALRSLLGFLHLNGHISHPLIGAVPSVAGWRLAALPKALTPRDLAALLASCDRRRATGRRDFAVLTLLARLGLRAGEVAALQLDDVDWRAGTIVVRGKGHYVEPLPLPRDVGIAVTDYLRRGRPQTALDRTVFVRVKAPHRALTAGGVTQVVAGAARRAGLGRIHAHRLRHTAATTLLRAGASLPEIGQVLRHRRALTTAIYAKLDRAALRTIAPPWPGGVA